MARRWLGGEARGQWDRAGAGSERRALLGVGVDRLVEAIACGEVSEEVILRNARRAVDQKLAWQLSRDGVAGKARPDPAVVESLVAGRVE